MARAVGAKQSHRSKGAHMSTTTLEIVEPATEQVLATLEEPPSEEVDDVIATAKRAFPAWRALDPDERSQHLLRLAEGVTDRLEALATLEARNVGKPITDARAEVAMVAHTFRYFAGAAERLLGRTIPVAGGIDMTFHEPFGVVGLIVPWNFPLLLASWKVAPALAAGNTVVVKPSELTPLTTLELARLADDVGIPPGVLNVVVGRGPTVGEHLVRHPEVAKIAFTGSTAVGRRISELGAASFKRITLELGGKAASLVFADADLEAAAQAAPLAVFGNAGQDCCARSRLLVEASILEGFVDLLQHATRTLTVGDPLNPSTQMGPLVSSVQLAKVRSYLTDDLPLLFQGSAPDGPGYWFPPTIACPVDNRHRAAQEEIFGPVVTVIPFRDESEAVRLANDSVYGLSGSIWTTNAARALRVARALDTGTISINSNTSVRVTTPFGGFKASGIGRELGPDALDYYTELKNVFVAT